MAKQLDSSAEEERAEAVPQTLNGLLAERLDRLPELAGVIDVAAVLGREFEADLAEALLPWTGRYQVGDSSLHRRGRAARRRGRADTPRIRRVLLQEAAYDRLVGAGAGSFTAVLPSCCPRVAA